MRAVLVSCLVASAALGQQKVVGAGQERGVSAPFVLNDVAQGGRVTLSQHLYLASELGFPSGARIVDVAWRKEYLHATTAEGCATELWLKNVASAVTEYAPGSAVTWQAATADATRVAQRAGVGLPAAMGFLGLHAPEDSLDFTYTGGNLEVTTLVDCSAVTGAVTTGPVLWRHDPLAGRGRGAVLAAAPTGADELVAGWHFGDRRPQTRLRFLVPGKRLAVRVGAFNIMPGATFAPAANYLAVGATVPNAYDVSNDGLEAVGVTAVTTQNVSANLAVTQTSPAFTTLGPGERRRLSFDVTPSAVGASSWQYRLTSDDPMRATYQWTIMGTTQASPMATPNFARVNPDGTTTSLMAGASLGLGALAPGEWSEVAFEASNYGSAPVAAPTLTPASLTNAEVMVDPLPTALGPQEDARLTTRVRVLAPGAAGGSFQYVAGGFTQTVTFEARGGEPELDVGIDLHITATWLGNGELHTLPGAGTRGMPEVLPLVLLNKGDADLLIPSDVVVSEQENVTAVITEQPPSRIAPRSTGRLVVRFTPTANAPIRFKLTVASNDADENPFGVSFTRASKQPKLRVTRRGAEIGNGQQFSRVVSEDTLGSETYVVSNVGDAPLTVSRFAATDRDTAMTPATPVVIAPGASTMFDVDLKPSERHVREKKEELLLILQVDSDDPERPRVEWTERLDSLPPPGSGCPCAASVVGADGLLAALALAMLRRRRPRS